MKAGPLKDGKVVEASKNLVIAYLDVDKGDVRPWAEEYGIRTIPAMIIINTEGEELKRTGYANANQLVSLFEEFGPQ